MARVVSAVIVAVAFATLTGVVVGVLTGVVLIGAGLWVAVGFSAGPVDDLVGLRVDLGGGMFFKGDVFLEGW